MFMNKNKVLVSAITVVALTFLMSFGIQIGSNVFDLSESVHAATYTLDTANANQTYTNQASYGSYAEAYSAFSGSGINAVIRDDTGKVLAMKRGMAVTQSPSSTLTFSSTYPGGIATYVSNNYAAYYQSTDANQIVTLTISGYTGTCPVTSVILIPAAFIYPDATGAHYNQYEFDYYTKSGSGDLLHYISYYHHSSLGDYYCTDFYSAITIDKSPDFMTAGVRYYSTDGIYYYTNPYDAAAGNTSASSYVGSYCIYYKWLSYRSETNYNAAELNAFIAYKDSTVNTSVTSGYLNLGGTFLSYGDTYGVNAAMELAFANHESAYGESSIAQSNYNYFGVGAVDSDPSQATTYANASDCILQHMKYFMSRYYIDAYAYINPALGTAYYDVPGKTAGYISGYSGDSRYFGNSPGNKLIGINVKYASDPFHGEKVAAKMYDIDKQLGLKDYNEYSIGFTNQLTNVYSQPSDSSWVLYKYTSKDPSRSSGSYSTVPIGMSVTIVGQTGDYYIIVSDMPINSAGYACYTWDKTNTANLSFTAYVKKSNITLLRDNLASAPVVPDPVTPVDLTSTTYTVNETNGVISKIASGTQIDSFVTQFANGSVRIFSGSTELTSGTLMTGMTARIYDSGGTVVTDYSIVVTGDINGDGTIDITDLIQLKRQILKTSSLNGSYLKASDTNGDGSTDITDLIQIKRSILGTQAIIPN